MNEKQIEVPIRKRRKHSLGMVLGQDDLMQEFPYISNLTQYLAREVIGLGTVSGLQVSTASDEDAAISILVNAGLAIDSRGNIIYLASPVQCPPPDEGMTAYLVLQWAERETDPVSVPGTGEDGEKTVPSQVEEYAILRYETDQEAAKQSGVILACLKKARGKWKIDKEYRIQRRMV